jgi:hypothetical protein
MHGHQAAEQLLLSARDHAAAALHGTADERWTPVQLHISCFLMLLPHGMLRMIIIIIIMLTTEC